MTTRAAGWLDRFAAASGILAIALSFGGFTLIASAGFAAQPGMSAEQIGTIISREPPPVVFIGLSLDTFGSGAFLLFAARTWATLREGEAAPAWISVTAFGAALLGVAASFVDKAAFYAIFVRSGQGLDPAIATALYDVAAASFNLFRAFVGIFFAAVAIVALGSGVLPRWLGWFLAVTAILAVVGSVDPSVPIGQLAFPLILLGMLALSIALLRRPLAPGPRA
jgi:hypothetical protein